MLKEVETSIRGKVGLNKRAFDISFNDQYGETGLNYADVTIKLKNYPYPSLILECTGTFNHKNMTGYAKYSINRINSYAKTECIANTIPDKCLFISLIRNDSNRGIFTFRIWCTKKVSASTTNTIHIRCLLSCFDVYNTEDSFELVNIVKGYEEPLIGEIVPMIEGDSIIGWCVGDDSDAIGKVSYIKNSDCLKVCWPSNNAKYKVVRRLNTRNAIVIETKDTLYQSWNYGERESGVITVQLPVAFNKDGFSYTTNVSPLTNPTSFTNPVNFILLGGDMYRHDSIGIWLSKPTWLEFNVFGYNKNPRFNDCSYLYSSKLTLDDKKNLKSNNAFGIHPHLLYIGKEDKYAKVS